MQGTTADSLAAYIKIRRNCRIYFSGVTPLQSLICVVTLKTYDALIRPEGKNDLPDGYFQYLLDIQQAADILSYARGSQGQAAIILDKLRHFFGKLRLPNNNRDMVGLHTANEMFDVFRSWIYSGLQLDRAINLHTERGGVPWILPLAAPGSMGAQGGVCPSP